METKYEGSLSSEIGELNFTILYANGPIIISFDRPIAWLTMQPQEAVAFANELIVLARLKPVPNSDTDQP